MNTTKPETSEAVAGPVQRTVRPTHWMDDRRMVVTNDWLQSEKATSDYRAAYVIPCKLTSIGVLPIYRCKTCGATGELDDGDACHDCGGSGGLPEPAGPNVF